MNIYVGNLAYETTEEQLRELFGQYGEVKSTSIILDRVTGRSRGFGFVQMADNAKAQEAIDALNDQECNGRKLKISQAREKTASRPPRRGGGGGFRGNRGDRGEYGDRGGGYRSR